MSKDTTALSVRAIISTENGLIMVEQQMKGREKILIFPGGGIEKGELIFEAVEREVLEETNLVVKPEKIVYMREVSAQNRNGMEFYVYCSVVGGELSLGHDPEFGHDEQILKAAREVLWEEVREKKWFPEHLHDRIEDDCKNVFSDGLVYLGIKEF